MRAIKIIYWVGFVIVFIIALKVGGTENVWAFIKSIGVALVWPIYILKSCLSPG